MNQTTDAFAAMLQDLGIETTPAPALAPKADPITEMLRDLDAEA